MKKLLGLFVLATMLAVPAMASAADKLPAGFIALAEKEMSWADAKAFCKEKGGKLPLIGGSESRGDLPTSEPIDGFGSRGAPWPAGLPTDNYWTGTVVSGNSGDSWAILEFRGNVGVDGGTQNATLGVACVPLSVKDGAQSEVKPDKSSESMKKYMLKAKDADLSKAPDVIVEGSPPNLGGWRVSNKVSFSVDLKQPGGYTVFLEYSKDTSVGDYANLRIIFENAASGSSISVTAHVPHTETWSNYKHYNLCSIWPLEAGKTVVRLESTEPGGDGYVMNLRSVTLSTGGDEGTSAPAVAAATLPSGFIALAENLMNWEDAKAFCKEKGGQLPLIGGKNSLSSSPWPPSGTIVGGFRATGAPWPSGLPSSDFWTGTVCSDGPDRSWNVTVQDGNIAVGFVRQRNLLRVVCVP